MRKFYRNIGNAFLFRATKILVKVQLFIQLKLGFFQTYVPNAFIAEDETLSDERASFERLKAINEFLPNDFKPTTLDIGCNMGFFTFQMAKRGGFSIGIDYGRNEIMAAKGLASWYSVSNVVFTQMKVTPENSLLLPKVDMVICLSIYHHWVRKLGEEESLRIMRGLAGSAGKYFVFDTGQPNEKGVEWNQCMNFIGSDINNWATNYFKELGFDNVYNLGDYKTSLSDVPRTLFIAVKD
jgi:SAM-dependent methyltransferase